MLFQIVKSINFFQRCEIARGSGYFDKMTFKPYVSVEFSSILMEIKMKGETFFDVQFGISGAKMALCCDVQGQVTGPKTLSKVTRRNKRISSFT